MTRRRVCREPHSAISGLWWHHANLQVRCISNEESDDGPAFFHVHDYDREKRVGLIRAHEHMPHYTQGLALEDDGPQCTCRVMEIQLACRVFDFP